MEATTSNILKLSFNAVDFSVFSAKRALDIVINFFPTFYCQS